MAAVIFSTFKSKIITNKIMRIAFVSAFVVIGYLTFAGHADTASQLPISDVASSDVVGQGKSTTDLYKDVSDGTSFSSADDNASYVRGESGVPLTSHTVAYTPLASNVQVSAVTVNFRAYKGSADGGSAQVQLYNGSTLIGTGAKHTLGSSYQNYSDTFSGLSLSGARLRTKMLLRNTDSSGAPRYTLIWIHVVTADSSSTGGGNPSPSPTPTPTPSPSPTPTPTAAGIVHAAFYYPWFPETWGSLASPFTNYHPSLGYYSSDDSTVIAKQVAAMQYAHLDAAISSWWGQKQHSEDTRFPAQLAAAKGTSFKWSLYYEKEGVGDPTVAEISGDLTYIKARYAANANYLTINGKPAIFVYGDANDGCGMADRWKQANAAVGNSFYVILKVFPGYTSCASQPDSWHQYGPAVAEDHQPGFSFEISPGFWKKGETTARLARDTNRWQQDIKSMVASNESLQLVTTFNEWGEGTAVESAQEWSSASGYGSYIDALHNLLPAPATTTGSGGGSGGGGGSGSSSDPIITTAGDISCDPTDPTFNGSNPATCQMAATAKLIAAINPSAVLDVGDNQYESGTLSNYTNSYDKFWGTFKAKTKPVLGNHEGGEGGSNAGYFDYFNGVGVQSGLAGNRSQGYYSYDVGSWHIIALNSNCGNYSFNGSAAGCANGSPQEQWLKADLAAHQNVCTLAYWHVPRFSSGSTHHNDASTDTVYTNFWNDLYTAGADVVINGHDHDYERFAPLKPNGTVDASNGITEFVAGTGGKSQYSFNTVVNGSAARGVGFGVLKLQLHSDSYDWQFVDAPGSTIVDSGTAQCHGAPGATPPPADTQPPTVPSGFSAAASANAVNLKWNASTDNVQVNSYRIYRNGNTVASVNGSTLQFVDTSVLPNTKYTYQVSAVDLAGNESGLSQAVTLTTPPSSTTDTTPPTVPANLTGTFVPNTQVNLTWNASTDNVGVAGYDVLRNGTLLQHGVQTTSYGDNTVATNSSYTYTVKAYDAAGNMSQAASVVVATTVAVTPPPSNGPCGQTATAPSKYKHVIWIWMENHSYSQVIGTAAAPYQTQLANQCGTDTQMRDAGSQYNSLSNYIAATTGLDSCSGGSSCGGNSTWNDCTFNASSCSSPNDNLFRQVRTAGGTAMSFEESMPSNCFQNNSGSYAIRHNPAAYFVGGSDQTACKTDDVPLGTTTGGNFLNALASDTSLPTFSFITPNVCNDTHDCAVGTGDAWLQSWMPLIFNSPAYKSGDTAVMLWYDEDTPIPNVVIAPSVKHAVLNDSSYSHYSLLLSTEQMLGLPTLGKASSAPSFRTNYNL